MLHDDAAVEPVASHDEAHAETAPSNRTPKARIQNTVTLLRARLGGANANTRRYGRAVREAAAASSAKAGDDADARALHAEHDDGDGLLAHGVPDEGTTAVMTDEHGTQDSAKKMSEQMTEEENFFLTAGLSLLKHGSLKSQLHDALQRLETRGAAMLAEQSLACGVQSEVIKASATKRRIIMSLQEQIKAERARADKLAIQHKEQQHPSIIALEKCLALFRSERADLEARVAEAEVARRTEQVAVLKLRGIVAELAAKSEHVERQGLRAAKRTPTAAETDHRNDVHRWISLLRGETEEQRQERAKQRKIREQLFGEQRTRSLALYLRPQAETVVGAMGEGKELEDLLSVHETVTESNRVEKKHHLQQRKMAQTMQLIAPDLLRKRQAEEQQRKMIALQEEASQSVVALHMNSTVAVTGADSISGEAADATVAATSRGGSPSASRSPIVAVGSRASLPLEASLKTPGGRPTDPSEDGLDESLLIPQPATV